jgi:hypothetical protein
MLLPGINVTAVLRFSLATLHVSLHALMSVSSKNFFINISGHLKADDLLVTRRKKRQRKYRLFLVLK